MFHLNILVKIMGLRLQANGVPPIVWYSHAVFFCSWRLRADITIFKLCYWTGNRYSKSQNNGARCNLRRKAIVYSLRSIPNDNSGCKVSKASPTIKLELQTLARWSSYFNFFEKEYILQKIWHAKNSFGWELI